MKIHQEPKYCVGLDGALVNRQSGESIPDDEPIFILRGRDKYAADVLVYYEQMVADQNHAKAVSIRRKQFERFAKENPTRMKEPDTTLTDDWNP